ncbi:MAG: AarF/UbiB family protein [Bdellovibrionota bacterium]
MKIKYFFYSALRLIESYLLALRYFFVYWWWTAGRILFGAHKDSFNKDAFTLGAWCFRRMLESLGATYVKMGQIMSTRPDIFPPFLIDELKLLQDHVPPFDSALIPGEFILAFGKKPSEIFEKFNETPIASASVAQVHEAYLKTGERVAVKIRRPGMKQKVDYDLAVMRIFAKSISFIPTVAITSPVESVEEFGKAIQGQLDLRNEAENNRRFQEKFKGNAFVRFPKLYEDYCSENILTMEFVVGYKVEDVGKSNCSPELLARHGLHAIFQMIYRDGFVHADLHPGNILFQDGNVAVYLDLGMVAELTDHHRERFIEAFMAMANNDGKTVARLMADYSPTPHKIKDWAAYERDVAAHISQYFSKPLNEIEISVGVGKMVNILRKHRVRVDASYTVVNVALLVAEGMGRRLYPQINLNQELYPFLSELFQEMMRRRTAKAAASKAVASPPPAN